MDTGVIAKLVETLPRIKTKLQVIGLVIIAGGYLATRTVIPDSVISQISVGAIGVAFIVFGQVFHYLRDFPVRQRGRLIISLFVIFLLFVLTLVIFNAYHLQNMRTGSQVDSGGLGVKKGSSEEAQKRKSFYINIEYDSPLVSSLETELGWVFSAHNPTVSIEIGHTGSLETNPSTGLCYFTGGVLKVDVQRVTCYKFGDMFLHSTLRAGNNCGRVVERLDEQVRQHTQRNASEIAARITDCVGAL